MGSEQVFRVFASDQLMYLVMESFITYFSNFYQFLHHLFLFISQWITNIEVAEWLKAAD
jgi:hypothetical protein